MEIKNDLELNKCTTFHVGGLAKNFYIPENENEVIDLLNREFDSNEKIYIISGGSNLLINDEKVFHKVISTQKVDDKIRKIKDGQYYVGCSCRIQNIINVINKDGYGGFEELYSLPAMFGGIIYMNAGIGGKDKSLFTISDFIEKVKVIEIQSKNIIWINKEDCEFSHRHSVFQNDKYFILGAIVNVKKQDISISKERINQRITKCKAKQEYGNGCFGTCFSIANSKLLKITRLFYGKKGNVSFSKKNPNWFVNMGNGKYQEAIYLIDKCKLLHRFFKKEIECEIRIWE